MNKVLKTCGFIFWKSNETKIRLICIFILSYHNLLI